MRDRARRGYRLGAAVKGGASVAGYGAAAALAGVDAWAAVGQAETLEQLMDTPRTAGILAEPSPKPRRVDADLLPGLPAGGDATPSQRHARAVALWHERVKGNGAADDDYRPSSLSQCIFGLRADPQLL